ncbi:hypothetical protein ABNG03_05130 [Halorubrum sp. RMP-47]|uniref:hypothetical protein n=1 Tax=Halorubrum miltondacostae TaxID=3076378 RepID=UPI003528A467
MAANRGFVALLALAVLVWGVAFSGGLTVALLTSTADVTTTFETPAELAQIDESSGSGFGAATAPVGNETNTGEENGIAAEANGTEPAANGTAPINGSAPAANSTETGENVSAPTDGNVSAPEDENASAPTSGNTSAPAEENLSAPKEENGSSSPSDAPDPVTNGSAPTGNSTAGDQAAADANDLGAVGVDQWPDSSRSGGRA